MSLESITKIVEILREHKIPYELKTIRSRGTAGRSIDVCAYEQFNLSMGNYEQTQQYVYEIWVSRKNLERAKKLVGEIGT